MEPLQTKGEAKKLMPKEPLYLSLIHIFAANLTNTVNCDRLLKDAVPAVSFIPENTLNHARREGEAFSWYLEIFFSEFG